MEQRPNGILPYEALRNAVVIQAAKDYRKALKALKRNPNNHAQGKVKAECEQFFCSKWFSTICDVSGKMIMEEIQKEEA